MTIDLPSNWEQLESEHNKHYDPHADICPDCGNEDSYESYEDEEGNEVEQCVICGRINND